MQAQLSLVTDHVLHVKLQFQVAACASFVVDAICFRVLCSVGPFVNRSHAVQN